MRLLARATVSIAAILAASVVSVVGAQVVYADVSYAISGTVTDGVTGRPVAGAVVQSDQVDRTTTDEAGRYTLRVMPSPLPHFLSVSADLYYTPPRPTEVLVTDADVSGVDIKVKRDRSTIRPASLELVVEVKAVQGKTVVVDLGRYVTSGSYPIEDLEFGVPNIAATPSGARYVLDHQATFKIGRLSITGARLTFVASRMRTGTATVDVMALDPYNFGGTTTVNLVVKKARASR